MNRYEKSREIMDRAFKVIPSGVYGHMGPTGGRFVPVEAFPFFAVKSEGAYFWDADGNRFIDYMCAYGSNLLGYNDVDVDAACAKQTKEANLTSLPNPIIVDLAQTMVDMVVSGDWAFFAKNGGDVLTLAIMAARAETGRKKIIYINGYDHGVAPFLQHIDAPGIIAEDVANNLYVDWNNFDQLERVIEKFKDEIAGFVAAPYMKGNFIDSILPAPDYWPNVRKICDENDIVLIMDDTASAFRLDVKGSDYFYGFKADLTCFGNSVANGMSFAALMGKEKLRKTVASITYSGSNWMSAVPFAAALACLKKVKEENVPAVLYEKGVKLTEGLSKIAQDNGFYLSITGMPQMFYMRIADDDSLSLHQKWIAECVKRGIFFTNHHNLFINYRLSEADIEKTLEVCDQAFKAIKK